MSSVLAIAAVTHVLKSVLTDGLGDLSVNVNTAFVGNINVSTLPPPDPSTIPAGGQLNLFMYRVAFNQGWKNVDLPSFGNQGGRVSNPPLALNLHYLLTSYGANELHTEIILGCGMQLLHEAPVLDRKAIHQYLKSSSSVPAGTLPEDLKELENSGLAEQVEQIKIIPENLSTEEISKLWTAFGAKYRPTAAYQVSVVLIESNKSTKSALRIKQPNIYVNPFYQPVIEKIKSQKADGEPIVENQQILVGFNLILSGRQLKSDDVKVNVGGIDITPIKENITESQIIITLPDSLIAGIQTIRVNHKKMKGSIPDVNYRAESNLVSFVLSPCIKPGSISIIPASGNDPAKIKMTINPPVKDTQRLNLLLNEYLLDANQRPSHAYSFQAPVLVPSDPPKYESKPEIPIKDVKPGKYLVRVQVDGAESPLEIDASGNYVPPLIEI